MSFLFVKAYYGPSNKFDNCIHKPQLLAGLKVRLQNLGFRVVLIPVDFIDYCMLEMCGHEVFRCNLKHLKFNTRPERDPVCKRAVEAVMSSAVKFRRARAYLWFWTLMDHQLFRRGPYSPKDYFAKQIFPSGKSCLECVKCCDLDENQEWDSDGLAEGAKAHQVQSELKSEVVNKK